MFRKLLTIAMIAIFLSPGFALAQKTFDYEATKAKYSTRDYVYSKLPRRGYNYFKIAQQCLVRA